MSVDARRTPFSPRFLLLAATAIPFSTPLGVQAASGDSDAYGYIVRGADDGGVAYEYEEALIPVPLDEETFQSVSIPFAFPMYGSTFQSVEIHDNGALSFGLTRGLGFNHDCSALSQTAPTVWAHWADMAPTQATVGGIYYSVVGQAPSRRLVVEWDRVPVWNVGGDMSFEIKLFEADGRIEFHYTDMKVDDGSKNNGGDAVVGITDGPSALLFSCDEPNLSDPGAGNDHYAVTLYPPPADIDCDDDDANRYPGAPELCNGVDDDCDGLLPPAEQDVDDDLEMACAGDCDDSDPTRYSAAEEVCNGIDDDCNETLPPSERDVDQDGFSPCRGDCNDNSGALSPADADNDDWTSCDGDCNDEDALILPGAAETCDGVDNDCNDVVDDNPNCEGPGPGVPVGVPYGCLLGCNAAAEPVSSVWMLAPLALIARRRRPGLRA